MPDSNFLFVKFATMTYDPIQKPLQYLCIEHGYSSSVSLDAWKISISAFAAFESIARHAEYYLDRKTSGSCCATHSSVSLRYHGVWYKDTTPTPSDIGEGVCLDLHTGYTWVVSL